VPSLHVDARGVGEPLVLVHGFTQSAQAWGPVGELLGARFRLLALDAPGHGRAASVSADLPSGADLMAEAIRARVSCADWLGYSMGGRFALHVALRHPDVVSRLVLVSATAGIDDPVERAERRRADERLAEQALDAGVERFVRDWLGQPLFASLPPAAASMEGRLGGTASGLASSLRLAGTGTQQPLWSLLPGLSMPVLVVAGSLDTKYTALASRLVDGIGANAALHLLHGAGHACHLEKPAEFVEAVTAWLAGPGD